ncbi:hypothetical protein [Caenispirillum bisanense]|uniref:hypothetical protein n=1 Tax=Caenispirillum bisanense TaxID=414052 RepID=UPI0031E0666B
MSAPPAPAPYVHPLGAPHERMLLDDLRRLDGDTRGRTLATLRLSGLRAESRPDSFNRDIEEAMAPAVAAGVKTYWTRDGDLMAVYADRTSAEFEAAVVRVRFLLGSDPLADAADLVARRSFADHYGDLLREAEDRVIRQAADDVEIVARSTLGGLRRAPQGEPLTPGVLGRIESMLANASLASHIRRQAVAVMVGDGRPSVMFTEVFVSIADLRETLMPTVDLASNPWLFQRLTQTLDRRVLALLARRDDRTLGKGFSINLNVASILSDEFLAFDDELAAGSHGTVVIELRAEDIFADLAAYTFARDFLRQRGYRVCLDGVTWRSLAYVDPKRLGAELVKLSWTPELPKVLASPQGAIAREALRAIPPGRLILARCDSEEAVDFGRSQDITLYQGRLIDTWMRGTVLF